MSADPSLFHCHSLFLSFTPPLSFSLSLPPFFLLLHVAPSYYSYCFCFTCKCHIVYLLNLRFFRPLLLHFLPLTPSLSLFLLSLSLYHLLFSSASASLFPLLHFHCWFCCLPLGLAFFVVFATTQPATRPATSCNIVLGLHWLRLRLCLLRPLTYYH